MVQGHRSERAIFTVSVLCSAKFIYKPAEISIINYYYYYKVINFIINSTVSKKSTHANKRLILLFKQTDLRIHDNLVLKKALSLSQPILPLFCFDPRFLGKTKRGEERMSLKRFNFLLESRFGIILFNNLNRNIDFPCRRFS